MADEKLDLCLEVNIFKGRIKSFVLLFFLVFPTSVFKMLMCFKIGSV